jgi:hypothetical protein
MKTLLRTTLALLVKTGQEEAREFAGVASAVWKK